MAEALTRIPKQDISTPVLTNLTSNGFNLIFTFSDGSTVTQNLEPYLDQLVLSIENTVVSNIQALAASSSKLNPAMGEEKNGDVRVTNNVASIFVNTAWVQVWPF